jgi:hypothetical protein
MPAVGQVAPRNPAGAVRGADQPNTLGEARFRACCSGEPQLRSPNTVVLHTNRMENVTLKMLSRQWSKLSMSLKLCNLCRMAEQE